MNDLLWDPMFDEFRNEGDIDSPGQACSRCGTFVRYHEGQHTIDACVGALRDQVQCLAAAVNLREVKP